MNGVPREGTAALEALFPGRFAFSEARDNFDYLYESEKLITLSGKKLHGKRNFVNRFLAENEGRWAYEAVTPENLPECWRMNVAWCAENGCGEVRAWRRRPARSKTASTTLPRWGSGAGCSGWTAG